MNDPLLRMLARLPEGVPDAARAERVRDRCRSMLIEREAAARRLGARRDGYVRSADTSAKAEAAAG